MGESALHIIYTDGSSGGGSTHGNIGDIGSWAFIEIADDKLDGEQLQHKAGYVYDTTNNRMEMQAIINAISSVPAGSRVKLFSDSGYCVTGFNHPSYLKKWVHNGWRTSKKDPVENQDLWEKMLELDRMYDLHLVLIKGHNKDSSEIHAHWNDKCDKMCTEMRLIAVDRYTSRNVKIPYDCPEHCKFSGQLMDQNGMCYSCPVVLCKDPDPIIPFDEFVDMWLDEWDKFFRGEISTPVLYYGGEDK